MTLQIFGSDDVLLSRKNLLSKLINGGKGVFSFCFYKRANSDTKTTASSARAIPIYLSFCFDLKMKCYPECFVDETSLYKPRNKVCFWIFSFIAVYLLSRDFFLNLSVLGYWDQGIARDICRSMLTQISKSNFGLGLVYEMQIKTKSNLWSIPVFKM